MTTLIPFDALTSHQRYKLMASLIVPRPIALVTTLGEHGVINAAPFSMFNMLGEDPPILMISVNAHDTGALKDTAVNITREKEFVVHISDEAIAEKMHRCGDRLPAEQSELEHAGLTSAPSTTIRTPRIIEAPVAFECKLWQTLETASRLIFIGEVQCLHAREGLVDEDQWRVRLEDYQPVGRFGASLYVRTSDRFTLG
ncbi:flavin reductase domain-containing protein [Robbsia andropogonis]|uniref:Flavin reductase domain-containing protein n=1 Tax=Robbsia andropogonis TaxID=28092 RepID=A0A0F5JWD4_9BURK|nr:flavin reductase family protein [Robbsia andropogonis]KKB62156.1 flavin reductase domain-containing protein [Robbsia andropogonis]MCP1119548.1 flavin reductase family protein [Robbsia andropogonis]MCP1129531.1 flavin reductase family protein [Robbsia andropogonis]